MLCPYRALHWGFGDSMLEKVFRPLERMAAELRDAAKTTISLVFKPENEAGDRL